MSPHPKHATPDETKSTPAPAPASATPSAVRPVGVHCRLDDAGNGRWRVVVWTSDGSDLAVQGIEGLGDGAIINLEVTPRKSCV